MGDRCAFATQYGNLINLALWSCDSRAYDAFRRYSKLLSTTGIRICLPINVHAMAALFPGE